MTYELPKLFAADPMLTVFAVGRIVLLSKPRIETLSDASEPIVTLPVNAAIPLRVVVPVMVTVLAKEAAPVTLTVLLAVTAPVTPSVPPIVSLELTASEPLIDAPVDVVEILSAPAKYRTAAPPLVAVK